MSALPWFKLYADVVDNARLRLLAFEDRWHFVALCALKCDGLLDGRGDPLLERKIALKLGLQERDLGDVKRRLVEVGLIDNDWQPVKWEVRQRRRADVEDGEAHSRHKAYVYFIADEPAGVVKIGYSKNPWARVKDLQTAHSRKLAVVATMAATGDCERRIHDALRTERRQGEWFTLSERIQGLIDSVKAKRVESADAAVAYCRSYVATTKDKEEEVEEDNKVEPKGSRASGDAPAFTVEDFVEAWNETAETCGLAKIRKLTESRKRAFAVRRREYPEIADWQSAFRCLRESKWMHGENKNGWRADPDFFLTASKFTKLVEGQYGQADR